MRYALHAEWTKLRTVAGPAWLAAATVVLTVALGALVAGARQCPSSSCSVDATKLALTGVQLAQAMVAALAVGVVGGEYSTGLVHATLTAVPRRLVALAAKVSVIAAVTVAVAAVAVAGSLLAGRLLLPGRGLTDGATLRAAGGSVVYLTLVALLAAGLAAALRDRAVAIGTVLGLLYLFPVLSGVVTNPDWQRRLHQISPSGAGLAIQATIAVPDAPIGGWAGLGVAALWTAGALALGAAALHLRDA